MCAPCGDGVVERGEYQGSGLGLVDDKGRVAIPASLRSTLAQNAPRADGKDGGTVIIGVHQRNRCLVAYDPGFVAVLKSRLDMREAGHTTDDGEYDYNIKRRGANAFFWGVFDYIEIWDPKTLIDTDDAPDMMKSAARFHCAEKGIAL